MSFLTGYLASMTYENVYNGTKMSFNPQYTQRVMTSLGFEESSPSADLTANQVKNSIIISNQDEATELTKYKKAGVVSQSTQDIENVQKNN